MRILQIGNFERKRNFRFFYNTDYKIYNGLIRNGHCVLPFSDRDAARESSIFNSRQFGAKKANKKLLEVCDTIEPDFILMGHIDVIEPETLQIIRDKFKHIKMAQFNVDPLFADKNIRSIQKRVPVCDATFITTAGDLLKQFERPNHTVAFIPNPVDTSIFSARNFEKSEFEYDACFFGAGTYREQIMQHLSDALPDVRFSINGVMGNPKVFGATFQNIISNSCMGLNLSHQVEDLSSGDADFCQDVKDFEKHKRVDENCYPYLYSSARISQLMGNGLLVFGDNTTGLKDMFSEDEMVYYTDNDNLAELIKYYKENDAERRRIAKNGWVKSNEKLNTKRITQYMIDVTMGREEASTDIWIDK